MAAENENLQSVVGERAVSSHRRKDSEGDEIYEEALAGDEDVVKPQEAGGSGNVNADEGLENDTFEEAEDEEEEEEGGITSAPLPPFQLQQGGTHGVTEKREVDEAKAENVEMNSSDSHAGARGTAENAVGIEDEGKPSDSHGPENTEWMIPVEEKEESGVGLGQIEDNLGDAVTEESKEASDVSVKEEKVPKVPEEAKEAKYVLAVLEGVPTVLEEHEELPPVNHKGKEVPTEDGLEALTVLDEGKEQEFDKEVLTQEGVEAPPVLDRGEEEKFDKEVPTQEGVEAPPVLDKGEEEKFDEEVPAQEFIEAPAVFDEGKEEEFDEEVPAQEGVEAPTVLDKGEEEEFDEEVPTQEGVEAPTVLEKGDEEQFVEETPAVLDKGKKAPPVLEEAKERCAVLGKDEEAPPLVEELPLVLNKAEEFVEKVPAVPEEGKEPPPVLDEDKEAPAALKKGKEALDNIVDRTSADEEMMASQGKSSSLVIPKELNGKCAAGTDESEAKDTRNGGSDHTDITDGSEEPEVSKIVQKKLAQSELLEVNSSTNKGGVLPSMRKASAMSDSSCHSVDLPRAPPSRPAGLGSSSSLLEPAPRVQQQLRVNGTLPQRQAQLVEDPTITETEEYDETREKLQMIRVKFLRLAHRLGQTPHNVVVAQVLYRLGLAEQLRGSRNVSRTGAFSFDRASAMAEQLEGAGQEPLDFSCTIMVIGKTGVGKSATINSIFDEVKFTTDAFQSGTKKVQDIVGTVQGIKVRVIDTPGLLSSCLDQRQNKKILHSVKHFIKKTPPDIVLYLDRLDMQSRDHSDLPLLRTITDIFGASIWFNAIVVLTHAASAPPDGPNGTPLSYEMFVTQRSHVVQQAIRQAAGDMRLMNPVSLVENHSACRTNRAGQRVLPNGQIWKPHLLLLSFASKILAEANTLLKLQDSPPGKPFGTRAKIPPLPFLLSSLLQSRPPLKLPEEQFGDEEAMDYDLDEASDSDDESEYDELPPFKHLTKAQLAKLNKEQRRAYFDELDYREKLFMKKQLKEEKKRRKLLKKMAESAKNLPNDYNENLEEESGGAASVPVPVPDMPLPNSFDSDNPSHRYRYLDNDNQWLVRPVLETHGWDHDVGYEGVNVERLFVVKDKIPFSFSGQVTKDKKESNLQMELASSIKHGVGKATSFGFDMQTVGKDMAYTLRSEVRFSNFRCNRTAAGVSVNILGDALSAGVKLEDILLIHKRLRLVMTGGAMTSRGDVAYGGTLEATLRDKDHPLGRMLSTLGLSIMDWHGDLALGCNLQSQFPVGRTTNMITRANLNNKGAGQVSIRLNSSEQLQIALVALVPLFQNVFKNGLFGSSQSMQ